MMMVPRIIRDAIELNNTGANKLVKGDVTEAIGIFQNAATCLKKYTALMDTIDEDEESNIGGRGGGGCGSGGYNNDVNKNNNKVVVKYCIQLSSSPLPLSSTTGEVTASLISSSSSTTSSPTDDDGMIPVLQSDEFYLYDRVMYAIATTCCDNSEDSDVDNHHDYEEDCSTTTVTTKTTSESSSKVETLTAGVIFNMALAFHVKFLMHEREGRINGKFWKSATSLYEMSLDLLDDTTDVTGVVLSMLSSNNAAQLHHVRSVVDGSYNYPGDEALRLMIEANSKLLNLLDDHHHNPPCSIPLRDTDAQGMILNLMMLQNPRIVASAA